MRARRDRGRERPEQEASDEDGAEARGREGHPERRLEVGAQRVDREPLGGRLGREPAQQRRVAIERDHPQACARREERVAAAAAGEIEARPE